MTASAQDFDFEINLTHEDHLKIIKQTYDIASKEGEKEEEEEEDDDNKVTDKTEAGKKVSISTKGYDLIKLREDFKKLKQGDGGAVTLRITQTPASPELQIADLQLADKSFAAPAGQTLVTVGDLLENDIILLKTGVTFGSQFAILLKDGKTYIKDTTALPLKYETVVKINKEVKVPIHSGSVVSFGKSIVYGLTSLSPNLTLKFIKELQPSGKAYD